MSIQSALMGFLVSRMLLKPLILQGVIMVQTTAVATGTMLLAAGFVGILPALHFDNYSSSMSKRKQRITHYQKRTL